MKTESSEGESSGDGDEHSTPARPMKPAIVEGGLGTRLASNTLHAATGRIAGLLVAFCFTPLILRAIGTDGFAIWALFYSLLGYLASLDLGLVVGTLRNVAAARGRGRHNEAGAMATLGVLGFFSLGSVWLAVLIVTLPQWLAWFRVPTGALETAAFALMAGPVVFVVAGLAQVVIAVTQGYGRFDLANMMTITIALLQAVGFTVALRTESGLPGLVIAVGTGWAGGFVLGLMLIRARLPAFRWASPHSALTRASEAVRFGGLMQITNMLAAVHNHVDKLLLPRFFHLAVVTPFELGARAALAASALPQMLLLAVMPAMAALHAEDRRERMFELYQRANRYVLAAAVAVLAALLASADRLILAWVGAGQDDAAMVLRGIAVSATVAVATGVGTSTARAIGRPDLEARFGVVVVATHVALSLILIPRLGLAGAVAATIVANVAGAVFFLWTISGVLGWPRRRVLVRAHAIPGLAAALGLGAGLLTESAIPEAGGLLAWIHAAILAGVGAGVTMGVLLGFRYLDWHEARHLFARRRPVRAAGLHGENEEA